MVKRNFIRLLVAVLLIAMLSPCVLADAVERLAVEREVYDFLTEELMLSNAAACGVLANIEHESNFQPTIFGDKGTSYGLCQWHNDRFTALRGYCTALGLDYRTVEGQLAYLKYELGNKYTTLLLSLQAIDDTPDGAYRAAYLWCIQFEKPSNMQVKAAQRGELAQGKYWPRYNRYQPIIIVPEPEETEPNPEVIIEQLKQNPVTIPMPPGGGPHRRGRRPLYQVSEARISLLCPLAPARRRGGEQRGAPLGDPCSGGYFCRHGHRCDLSHEKDRPKALQTGCGCGKIIGKQSELR